MTASTLDTSWQQGQDALRDVVEQVTTLLRSVDDPRAHAVGRWNLGEVAMHLSQAWVAVPGLAKRNLSGVYGVVPSLADIAGESLITDMWDLYEVTTLAVDSDPERDPAVLADRIEQRAKEYFSDCVAADPTAPRPWLVQGATVSQSTLTYHLLNETVMHGGDIARAAGRPWPIEPTQAIMILTRFIVPVLQALDPRAFVNPRTAARLNATYEIHLRGGNRFRFIFDKGTLTVEDPPSPDFDRPDFDRPDFDRPGFDRPGFDRRSSGGRSVDCYISADPVALLNVIWGRQSQWPLIAKGKLLAWGIRPWLGFRFRSLIRNP